MTITLQNNSFDLTSVGGVLDSANPSGIQNSYLRFTSTRFIATGTGNIALTVERYGGTTGAISATITQTDCNRSTGKYTPVSIPVSFADGEIGEKTYNFNITTAPSDGPYWINLVLNTGAYAVRHWWDNNSEIEVNDGVSVPTTDLTNVYEVGPTGDYTTIDGAARGVQSPALILIRGGTYANEDTQANGQGINPRYSGDRSNRIYYMAYPTENVIVDFDSSITDMATQIPNNRGFNLRPSMAGNAPLNGLVFKGMTIKHASVGVYGGTSSTYHENIIVEDCIIEDIGEAAGSNPGGVRYDDSRYCTTRNNIIRRIYEGMELHLTEHDNNACVHGYRGADIVIEDNTMYDAAHCVYHKNPPRTDSGETAYVVRRNDFGNCYIAVRMEDAYIGNGTAIPYGFNNVDVYHNISRFSDLLETPVDRSFYGSNKLWVYGNTAANSIGDIGGYRSTEVYNNISIKTSGNHFRTTYGNNWIAVEDSPYDPADPSTWPIPGDKDSTNVHEAGTLEYFDYNVYDAMFACQLAVNSSSAQTFNDLASWRLATDPAVMPVAIAGQNSQLLDPMLDVNFRPTITMPAGRFGQVVGVPDSVSVGSSL